MVISYDKKINRETSGTEIDSDRWLAGRGGGGQDRLRWIESGRTLPAAYNSVVSPMAVDKRISAPRKLISLQREGSLYTPSLTQYLDLSPSLTQYLDLSPSLTQYLDLSPPLTQYLGLSPSLTQYLPRPFSFSYTVPRPFSCSYTLHST